MSLVSNLYNEDEEEVVHGTETVKRTWSELNLGDEIPWPTKRAKTNDTPQLQQQLPQQQREQRGKVGYTAKRFRASQLAHESVASDEDMSANIGTKFFITIPPTSSVAASLSDHLSIDSTPVERIPGQQKNGPFRRIAGRWENVHSAQINCVRWGPHTALPNFATASMDKSVIIWNRKGPQKTLLFHSAAARDVRWSPSGSFLASCGFENTAYIASSETGQNILRLHHPEHVTALCYSQSDHLLVAGLFNSGLVAWDLRANSIVAEYKCKIGMVHDILFPSPRDNEFVASFDVTKRSAVDKAIMAFDFRSGAPLFHQIYHEAYICAALRRHPTQPSFCAQSAAGYIIVCDAESPYKLNRTKRFQGHDTAGFRIGFDFFPDGSAIISGSSSGDLVVYDWYTTKRTEAIHAHKGACVDVAVRGNDVVSVGVDATVILWNG